MRELARGLARGQREAERAAGCVAQAQRNAALAKVTRCIRQGRVVGALIGDTRLERPPRDHAHSNGAVKTASRDHVAAKGVGHQCVIVKTHQGFVDMRVQAARQTLNAGPVSTQLEVVGLMVQGAVVTKTHGAERPVGTPTLAPCNLL